MAKGKSYEEKLEELEKIVDSMEENELSLDELIKNYEKGIKLYNELYKILQKAEGKIKILNNGEEENFIEEEE